MIDGIMANSIKQIGEVLLCQLFVHDFVVVVVVVIGGVWKKSSIF